MLKVHKILERSSVRYRGTDYPVAAALISTNTADENPYSDNFAPESLARVLMDDNGNCRDGLACTIDDIIYGYVPDECFASTDEDLARAIERFLD